LSCRTPSFTPRVNAHIGSRRDYFTARFFDGLARAVRDFFVAGFFGDSFFVASFLAAWPFTDVFFDVFFAGDAFGAGALPPFAFAGSVAA
jgi:hypothetical protein